jgi:Cu2+-containing amine oxidase
MDFEKLLAYLKEDILNKYIDNINLLVQDSTSISISKKKLDQWEKELLEELRLQSPEVLEAERVKAENRRLIQEMKTLERQYETLNREHVDLVNKYLLEKEKVEKKNNRIAELLEEIEECQKIIRQDRSVVEAQVQAEMQELAQKNTTLINYQVALEETISDLEHKLITSRNKLAECENERNEKNRKG